MSPTLQIFFDGGNQGQIAKLSDRLGTVDVEVSREYLRLGHAYTMQTDFQLMPFVVMRCRRGMERQHILPMEIDVGEVFGEAPGRNIVKE